MSFFAIYGDILRTSLRRLFRRTPPQTETGWTPLAAEIPAVSPYSPNETVELYSTRDDSLGRAYVWSLADISPADRLHYHWRRPLPGDATDRGFAYYRRSRSLFG